MVYGSLASLEPLLVGRVLSFPFLVVDSTNDFTGATNGVVIN